jgi:hypothetical protein
MGALPAVRGPYPDVVMKIAWWLMFRLFYSASRFTGTGMFSKRLSHDACTA